MKQIFTLATLAAAAIATVVAAGGGAQTPPARTLTLFQDTAAESNTIVDNAPKSPAKSPDDSHFRLSLGDALIARTPVFDHRGGRRIGTLYANVAVVGGSKFENATLQGQLILKLGHDSIVLAGLAGTANSPFAVIGGTGAYEGARGSATETELNNGARLTIRLLP
jgi:hypothetical protein